jgi:hypothetical protein
MSKSYDPSRYLYSSFDQWFCLKPPVLLWVATAFYARALVLMLIVAAGSLSGAQNNGSAVLPSLLSPGAYLAAVPAVLVLYALVRRSPESSAAVRWLFGHARVLLVSSVLIDLGTAIVTAPESFTFEEQNLPALLARAMAVYLLVYVTVSRRVRDSLSDFPCLAAETAHSDAGR